MPHDVRPSCVICAWRGDCKRQFSVSDPSRCPEFSLDVSVKDYPGKKGAKILIEGAPGTGKTTLTERLIIRLGRDKRVGGFYTREIREKGERTGFRIITTDNCEGVLARVDLKTGPKVGRYTVNLEDLDKIAVSALERAIREDEIIVVDEIGRMELFSNRFQDMINIAMDCEKPFVATIASEGPPFAHEIKRRPGVRLLTLTPGNRDSLLEEAAGLAEG